MLSQYSACSASRETMSDRKWKKPSLLNKFCKSKVKKGRYKFNLQIRDPAPAPSYDPAGDSIMDTEDHDSIEDTESNVEPKSKKQKRSYSEQKKKQTEAWDTVMESLKDKFIPMNVLTADTVCTICSKPANFRCTDCGPWISYCEQCCISQHNQCCFLHVPEKWENGQFVPVMLMNMEIPLDHCCTTEYKDKVTIISIKGYHCGVRINFCRCKTKVERLVELRLWPATPLNPRTAFTIELLDLIHAAILECQASLHHISAMLQCISILKRSKKKTTYQQLLACFPRYRLFKTWRVEATSSCPACPKDAESTLFISLDGNFRLCRRKNAGQRDPLEQPLSGYELFANQSDVDRYVQSSPVATVSESDTRSQCHDFKAGDALRSQSRYHALDETGIFGATCKHDIPLKMLSMKQGEKLAYADFILTNLVEEERVPSHVNVLYDIGCKLYSHWKRHSDQLQHLSAVFCIAVPIFHAYAHNVQCQFAYSPRHKLGFGLTDGENLERLWSYLGRFCKMTKEMSAAHRIDTLTDALSHYSHQKCGKMENSIVLRMKRALSMKLSSEQELGQTCVSITTDELASLVPQLRDEELKRLNSISRVPMRIQTLQDWKQHYVQLLQSWHSLQSKWMELVRSGIILTPGMIVETVSKLQKLDTELKEIEMTNHIEPRWQKTSKEFLDIMKSINASDQQRIKGKLLGVVKERIFYLNTLAHHAGGQKQAQRVSKLISMCTRKAKELLHEYKNHSSSSDQITTQEVFNMNSRFWVSEHTYAQQQLVDRIPFAEQRRLIELTDINNRCEEELQYCIADILNMYEYFTGVLKQLNITLCNELAEYCPSLMPDPSKYHLYDEIGKIIHLLPRPAKDVVSATIAKAMYTFYRLQRIEDVATNLVMAYWANSDRQQYMQRALSCSNLPICVPPVQTLGIKDDESNDESNDEGASSLSYSDIETEPDSSDNDEVFIS